MTAWCKYCGIEMEVSKSHELNNTVAATLDPYQAEGRHNCSSSSGRDTTIFYRHELAFTQEERILHVLSTT